MSRRGWVLFTAMSVIWGIPYLLIKVADGGVSVPVLVFTRVALGALLLLPVALRGRTLGALRGHWRWLIAFAGAEIVGPFALLSSAEKHLNSSTTGLLVAAVPIIGAVLVQFTGGQDKLTPIRWTGLIVGFAGVAVLAGPDAAHGDALSVAEVLLTALGYATGPLIANRKLQGVPPAAVNTVCLGMTALVYVVPAALTWPAHLPAAKVIASLVALGAICTATAFLVFFALIAEVGPARATVITYVNPAVAVALGVLILGEPLTWAVAGAFVLILGGSVLATRPSAPQKSTPETSAPKSSAPKSSAPKSSAPTASTPAPPVPSDPSVTPVPPAAAAALAVTDDGPRPADQAEAINGDGPDGQPLSRFSRSVPDGEPRPVQGSQPGPAE
ncbi:MAG: EamA family transporter [Actinobacteria bacterium]|nr:EamA family transporter [Actinomycetota bacterium]